MIVNQLQEAHLRSMSSNPKCCECHYVQICQNPLHKQKHLTWELNISVWSVSHILRNDLCLGAYWHCLSYLPNTRLKELSFFDAKNCGNNFQKIDAMIFCSPNRRFFCIREKVKWQNNIVLVKNGYKVQKQVH